jgi:hypothetical protein
VAGQSSQDLLQQTVDAYAQKVQQYADGIAGRLGSPLSGTQLSKDEVVARWNYTPLGSQQAADQQYHQLVAQGMAPGQALEQVYPMRSMLYRGASVQDSIATAKQIQGWVADASGQPAPELPQGSTMAMLLAAQRQQQPAPPPLAVGPALPPLAPGPVAPPSLPVPPVATGLPAGMPPPGGGAPGMPPVS